MGQQQVNVLVEKEIQTLMENEVPFFYTYEGSRDILSDGELLVRDYFEESAIERARSIILSLSEQEKQFEIRLMDLLAEAAEQPKPMRDLVQIKGWGCGCA